MNEILILIKNPLKQSFMAVDRTPFHKKCVKCKTCGKPLNSGTINEHQTQLYCKACYDNIFHSGVCIKQTFMQDEIKTFTFLQDYHSGSYGGIVTPEDIKRREEEEKRKREKLERQKNENRCPYCDMKAFPEVSIKLGDITYHKVHLLILLENECCNSVYLRSLLQRNSVIGLN